jgi:aarF domain-containing kinase
LLKLCEQQGGAFIKVGQHLGALDYLLPAEYVNTMKILHNQAPQSTYEEVLKVIKEDLKCEVASISSSCIIECFNQLSFLYLANKSFQNY